MWESCNFLIEAYTELIYSCLIQNVYTCTCITHLWIKGAWENGWMDGWNKCWLFIEREREREREKEREVIERKREICLFIYKADWT